MEFKPLEIELDGEIKEFDRDNAALFTYLGERSLEGDLSHYNHVFLTLVEEDEGDDGLIEENTVGLYIFESKNEEYYNDCVEHMEKYGFPMHCNLPDISAMDVSMWRSIQYSDLEEGFPEEWVS